MQKDGHMVVESFNFLVFHERRHLIPSTSTLASETPELKDKALCRELFDMDIEESQQIRAEESRLRTIEQTDWRLRLRRITLPSAATSTPAWIAQEINNSSNYLLQSSNLTSLTFAISVISLLGLSVAYMTNNPYSDAIQAINIARLLRLEQKERTLQERLSRGSEHSGQLLAAKAYFNLQYNLHLAKKTYLIVVQPRNS